MERSNLSLFKIIYLKFFYSFVNFIFRKKFINDGIFLDLGDKTYQHYLANISGMMQNYCWKMEHDSMVSDLDFLKL